jgi:very-short-patch-repair endonuclease
MTKLFNQEKTKQLRRSLRKQMPRAEVIVWSKIRAYQLLGFKFRRQYSVGAYILDFYCPSGKLGIELDGDTHAGVQAERHDRERDAFLNEHGIHALRFTNFDVFENLEGVLDTICEKLTSPNLSLKRRGIRTQRASYNIKYTLNSESLPSVRNSGSPPLQEGVRGGNSLRHEQTGFFHAAQNKPMAATNSR